MAKKIIRKTSTVKTPAAKARNGKRPAAKPAGRGTANTTGNARKVMLAGIGAVNRVQDETVKVYGLIAAEAQRLSAMTSEAAEALARKAGAYAREGKKIQSQAAALAQAKAAETANEVKAFAKNSGKTLKQNLKHTFNTAVAGAREGATQLEHVFETRVAKTLNNFGIPSSHDVRALQVRMAELQKALNQLNKRGVRA